MIRFLFRGKDATTGRFVTGDLVHGPGGVPAIVSAGAAAPRPCLGDTIGQSTGLKDAAEEDIFEGDILEDKDGRRILIVRDKEAPSFSGLSQYAYSLRKENLRSEARYLAANCAGMRIVGNIHDDPGLMQP